MNRIDCPLLEFRNELFADVLVPIVRMLFDELLHQGMAGLVFEDDHLDPARFQVRFSSHEGRVLACEISTSMHAKRSPVSPMTTRLTLYMTQAPVHMSQGERVVYIVAPRYAEAGSLPAFSRHEISACTVTQSRLKDIGFSTATYMESGTALLEAQVVASTEHLALGVDETCSYRHSTLGSTLLRLLDSCLESDVCVHLDDFQLNREYDEQMSRLYTASNPKFFHHRCSGSTPRSSPGSANRLTKIVQPSMPQKEPGPSLR